MTIRNPVEWGYDSVRTTMHGLNVAAHGLHRSKDALDDPVPTVRRITVSDLADVLKKGFEDFAASRTDLIFIAVVYPLAGLVLARLTIGYRHAAAAVSARFGICAARSVRRGGSL